MIETYLLEDLKLKTNMKNGYCNIKIQKIKKINLNKLHYFEDVTWV